MDKFRLPSEIPEGEWPSPSVFIEEARSCVKEAEDKGIILRIMGGMAIYLHSQEHKQLWENLGRLGKKVFTDIDFVSYGKFRGQLLDFFQNRGFTINQRMLYYYGKKRHIYYGEKIPMVEIFFDKLEMNHTIDFKKRLEVDSPTIPPAELLLQKIQMVRMNEKDIKDVIVLVRAREIGEGDGERINRASVGARLLSDWGFYYTATTNFQKITKSLSNYDALGEEDIRIVKGRINELLSYLEEKPKSVKWKSRALLGTKKKWYSEVDEWDVINSPSQGSAEKEK
ncbi:MAG: hypothetical protein KAW83_03055 [Dehalococcoidia bacterium]|nr:hypothetical protein [Dehalococcoidia bacterium]